MTCARRLAPAGAWLLVATATAWAAAGRAETLGAQATGSAGIDQRAVAELGASDDPDAMAAAALLTVARSPVDAAALIARAVEAAPARADLAWLQLRICDRTPGCDPAPFESRLPALDPDNGVGWLAALSRASEAADDVAMDAALIAAARSARIDIYYTTLSARLGASVVAAGVMPLPFAVVEVLGRTAGIGLPSYAGAAGACRGQRLARAAVLHACQSLAAALMAGDAVISEAIGTTIAQLAWPEGSPEWRAAVEARRVLDYRLDALGGSGWYDHIDTHTVIEYLDLLAQHRREQDVIHAQLTVLGIDPRPPAGWTRTGGT